MAKLKYTMKKDGEILIERLLIQYRPMDLEKDFVAVDSTYKSHKEYDISITGSTLEVFLQTSGNVLVGQQVKVSLTINGTELECNPIVFVVPNSGKIYQTIKINHNLLEQ